MPTRAHHIVRSITLVTFKGIYASPDRLVRVVAAHIAILAFSLLTSISGLSQESTDIGLPAFGSFNRDAIDTINVGNVNVHLQFPMFSKKSIGFNYTAYFVLDNNVLVPTSLGGGVFSWVYGGGGWRLSVSGIGSLASQTVNLPVCTLNQVQHFPIQYTNVAYVDSDNTRHSFPSATWTANNCSTITAQTYYSKDGERLDISAIPAGGNPSKLTVTDHSGNVFDADASAMTLTDPNGNHMTYWSDTTGSTPLSYTFNNLVTTYSYPGPSGTPEQVTSTQALFTIKTAFHCSGVSDISSQSTYLPTTIALPNGTSYSLVYESSDGTYPTTTITGRLHSLTLPSGAAVTYSYSGGTNGINCADGSPAILTKTTSDGTWIYNHSWSSATNQWTTLVTDAAQNDTEYTFGTAIEGPQTNSLETQRVFYQGLKASGNILKTVVTCYNGSFVNCASAAYPGLAPENPVMRTDAYTYLTGLSTPSLSERIYSSSDESLLLQHNDFDYGVNTNAAPSTTPLSATIKSYASLSNNIDDRPSCVQTTSGNAPNTCGTVSATTAAITKNSYDALGNMKTHSSWVSGTTYLTSNFTYYPDGLPKSSTDTNSNVTSYSSQNCGPNNIQTYIATVTTGSLSTNTTWNCDGGVPLAISDVNSQPTAYAYTDPFWRQTEVDFPNGGKTATSYNDTVTPSTVTRSELITSSMSRTTQSSFDGFGRLIEFAITSDSAGTIYQDTHYDSVGRVNTLYNPTRCNPPTTACSTETSWGFSGRTYDALNRLTAVTAQDGGVTSTSFSGNCSSTTDQAGKATTKCWNAIGQLISVQEDPSGLNYITNYTYDALGNLLTVTQKGGATSGQWRTRTFHFDGLSRLIQTVNPESGTVTYSYTKAGGGLCSGEPSAICQKTAPSPNQPPAGSANVTTTFTYDALNRLTGKSYSDSYASNSPTAAVTFGYDGLPPVGCTPPTVVAPVSSGIPTTPVNTLGRRSSMCDGSGATAWIYDSMGRPTIETRQLSSIVKSAGYVYMLGGQLQYLWYPSGYRMIYVVDSAGRSSAVQDSINNYVTAASYAPNGALSLYGQYARSGSYVVQATTNRVFDKRFKPFLEYAAAPGSVYLYKRCYDYHIAGGLTVTYGGFTCSSSTTTPGDNGDPYQITNKIDDSRTQNFTYDSLDRIQQAYTNGVNWGQQFAIDAWGNLTSVGAVSGKVPVGVFTATASTKNQLTCTIGCSASYDAAGNMLANPNGAIVYDAENRVLSVAGVTYSYDGDGKRVMKSGSTLYWTGVGSEVLNESNLSGSVSEEYVFFGGMRVAKIDIPSFNTHSFITDHLGSSRMMVIPSGGSALTVEEDLDYTPYGIVATGSSTDHYEFTGKERDSESGLDNFGARYDASSLGRFMSPDPNQDSGFEHMDDPQSWNGYSYVRNSPTTGTDPDGRNYTICDSNGKNCADLNEDQYKQYLQSLQGTNTTVNSAGQIQHTNDNGSVTNLGTATYYNEKDIQAAQMLVQTGRTLSDPRTIAGFYGASFLLGGCAIACPAAYSAAATTATGLFYTGLRAGMVIGGYIMTSHAVEQAEERGVTAEEIEEAVEGVAKSNPQNAWDSVQRFYTATCEVRVNKVTGTIVTVISKISR
jgi:RHS repeat-associated protein